MTHVSKWLQRHSGRLSGSTPSQDAKICMNMFPLPWHVSRPEDLTGKSIITMRQLLRTHCLVINGVRAVLRQLCASAFRGPCSSGRTTLQQQRTRWQSSKQWRARILLSRRWQVFWRKWRKIDRLMLTLNPRPATGGSGCAYFVSRRWRRAGASGARSSGARSPCT